MYTIKCDIINSIVRECLSSVLSNSNTVIGYEVAFYRESLNITILGHDLKYCLDNVKLEPLSIKRQFLHELSLAKCSQLVVNGFISEKIDDIITFTCSK